MPVCLGVRIKIKKTVNFFIITFYEDYENVLQQVVCLRLKLKGLVHPNMKIMSSFINLHVIPNLVRSVGKVTLEI